MRSSLIIRRTCSHRLACLSLYRALLQECDKFPHLEVSSNLRQLVRYRFEKDKSLRAQSKISNALEFGYEALTLLRLSQNGSAIALRRLTRSLSSATEFWQDTATLRAHRASIKPLPSPRQLRKAQEQQAAADKANQVRRPDTVPVLDRPVAKSELSGGQRIVPKLVVTQGIPFLRYGRPQPRSLSRIIRQLGTSDLKRMEKHIDLKHQVAMANYEDEWDLSVAAETGYRDPPEFTNDGEVQGFDSGKPFASNKNEEWISWTEAIQDADQGLLQKIAQKHRERSQTANKMWAVVLKERKLAAQEKGEMRGERKAYQRTLQENEK